MSRPEAYVTYLPYLRHLRLTCVLACLSCSPGRRLTRRTYLDVARRPEVAQVLGRVDGGDGEGDQLERLAAEGRGG